MPFSCVTKCLSLGTSAVPISTCIPLYRSTCPHSVDVGLVQLRLKDGHALTDLRAINRHTPTQPIPGMSAINAAVYNSAYGICRAMISVYVEQQSRIL